MFIDICSLACIAMLYYIVPIALANFACIPPLITSTNLLPDSTQFLEHHRLAREAGHSIYA
jgi:uncharacterized RDD family membrane protein YckC